MKPADTKVAGALLFVGGVQFILIGLVIAEALYPGYSVSANYISDLGVGTTSLIFNSSVFVFGLAVLASSYFVQKAFRNRLFTILFVLAGVGAMGVGLFPETFGAVHSVAALFAFLFGALSAIAAYWVEKPPLTYLSVAMGILSLVALVLYATRNDLGLGIGGMERIVAYPMILWAIGFGGFLIGSSDGK